MMPSSPIPGHAGTILTVPAERRLEAVQRLVGAGLREGSAAARRFLQYAEECSIPLDHMWSCLDDETGDIVATVLAVPSPGRTAMLFVSPLQRDAEIPPLGRVVAHAIAELGAEDVDLLQALLDPSEQRQRAALMAGGFTPLARLSYMERPLPAQRGTAEPEHPGVSFRTYCPTDDAELIGILEASYEDTRDCPGLRGLRRTEDILAGHRATGVFDPSLWTLMEVDGRPAGALLLNPSPPSKTIELVYIGLAPFAQGDGHGGRLLRYGLRLVAGRTERAITLAVDEDNAAAIALYRRTQFRRVLRRVALIRPLRVVNPPSG